MARSKSMQVENNFTLGLVTETTALKFPPNSCTETYNCIFDSIGNVTRRKGIDVEEGYGIYTSTLSATDKITEYVWTSVGGDGDKSFLVIQKGNILHFYDVSDTPQGTSLNKDAFTYSLTAAVPSGSPLIPQDYTCSFTNGRGKLVVTNRAIEPVVITYSGDTSTFSVVITPVQFRDFEGLVSEHSTSVTARLSADITVAGSTYPNHLYNLYNQGWAEGGALSQWDTARGDLPSNADRVSLYRASETDIFDPAKADTKTPGNSQATRGHFIITVGKEERAQVSGVALSGNVTQVPASNFSPFSLPVDISVYANVSLLNNSDLTPSYINSGVSSKTLSWSGTPSLLTTLSSTFGLDYSTQKKVAKLRVYRPIDRLMAARSQPSLNYAVNYITFTLYAKVGNTPPSSRTDGVVIGFKSVSGNVPSNYVDIVSTDQTTTYGYVWVNMESQFQETASATAVTLQYNHYVSELQAFEPNFSVLSYNRPEVTAFFAGRTWFAANSYSDRGTNIYFSQVIQAAHQIGKCYQKNDPTSEQFFSLLPDDGGSVSIPEIANVIALFPMRSAMVVLASNGTWVIRGGSSEGFSASNYRVEKVSGIGCVSRLSVTDVKGIPQWAGEDGFYTIEYDPNYNAFQQKSLSDERIRTFYQEIPANNRRYIKGTYDTSEQIVRYIYNDADILPSDQLFIYNKQLNYDINTKAWYPWTLPEASPKIRGIINVVDSNHIYESRIKYIVTQDVIPNIKMTLGEQRQGSYYDWDDYSTTVSLNASDKTDYESYFITAPKVKGEAMRNFQANYLTAFLNPETDASCKINARFDWTNSGSSGRWTTVQEGYGTLNTNRDLIQRRLKIRGTGKSVQFKFGSSSGKPFNIVGWSTIETMNAGE